MDEEVFIRNHIKMCCRSSGMLLLEHFGFCLTLLYILVIFMTSGAGVKRCILVSYCCCFFFLFAICTTFNNDRIQIL